MKTAPLYRLMCLSFASLFLVSVAIAQDTQRFEAFGGYSLLHGDGTFNGWDAASTIFLNRWFGVTSDFSGQYQTVSTVAPGTPEIGPTTFRIHQAPTSFLFGPHFTYRHSRYAPFAQALFGVNHTLNQLTVVSAPQCPAGTQGCAVAGQTYSQSYNKFGMALGGGIDIAIGHGISLRPVQAEYFLRRFPAAVVFGTPTQSIPYFNLNEFRYSAGISFRFGQHLGKNR